MTAIGGGIGAGARVPVRGLIFDFDGLILETEGPVYTAWCECYRAHGRELPVETYARCVGTDTRDYHPGRDLERLTGRSLDWEELDRVRRARVAALLENAEPMPGVRRLLVEAAALGMPCAVASSSSEEWVVPWLEKLGLLGTFRTVRCAVHAHRPKPDPALFLRAAEGLGIAPGEALVFEDSLNGLRAARAAGMRCVVVPTALTRHLEFGGAALRLGTLGGVELRELLRKVGGQ